MNASVLRRLDAWVGGPVCEGLTLVRRMGAERTPPAGEPVRNVLFIKLIEQGSTVLAVAALRRAIDMVGRDRVYFIAFEENRFIVDAIGIIPPENVITVSASGAGRFLSSGLAAMRRLWALRIDAAVDLEFFARGSAALAFLSGARRRVGFHGFFGAGARRGDLLTHRLLYNPYLHTEQAFLSLVNALEQDPEALPTFPVVASQAVVEPPRFAPTAEELAAVRRLLEAAEASSASLILLNPNASDLLPLRKWPTDRYVQLAKRLLDRFPEAMVAITGGPGEEVAAGRVCEAINSARCFSLAGKTTLRQLLGLYSLSQVLVTNDSGPAHFATLTPIRTVTLFGPETPALFAAARTPRNTPLWAGLACSPCVSAFNGRESGCRNNLCMQMISVDEVFEAVCSAYDPGIPVAGSK